MKTLTNNHGHTYYYYYLNRKRIVHRTDGPAVFYKEGKHGFYWHGKWCRNVNVYCKRANIRGEDRLALLLKYSGE